MAYSSEYSNSNSISGKQLSAFTNIISISSMGVFSTIYSIKRREKWYSLRVKLGMEIQ